jgi:hypothetical protein
MHDIFWISDTQPAAHRTYVSEPLAYSNTFNLRSPIRRTDSLLSDLVNLEGIVKVNAQDVSCNAVLSGVPVTTAWCVLRLLIEERPSDMEGS